MFDMQHLHLDRFVQSSMQASKCRSNSLSHGRHSTWADLLCVAFPALARVADAAVYSLFAASVAGSVSASAPTAPAPPTPARLCLTVGVYSPASASARLLSWSWLGWYRISARSMTQRLDLKLQRKVFCRFAGTVVSEPASWVHAVVRTRVHHVPRCYQTRSAPFSTISNAVLAGGVVGNQIRTHSPHRFF